MQGQGRAMMQENQPSVLGAAIWMLGAMIIIGFIDNFVAQVSGVMGLWQFFVLRTLIVLPALGLVAVLGFGRLRARNWRFVLLRSTLVAIGMLCYFAGLGMLPIAQALAGLYTSPIFILLISWAVLRQSVGPWRVSAVVIGFTGVLFVLQPDGEAFHLGLLVPVAGGFFYAMGAMITRTYCAQEDTLIMVAGVMGLQGAISALILAGFWIFGSVGDGFLTMGWVWPVTGVWYIIWLQAIGSILGVYGIIKAYQMGDPAFVSVIEYSVMIFGPGFAFWIFGTPVTWMQGIGIVLISVAGIVIAWRSGESSGSRGLAEP